MALGPAGFSTFPLPTGFKPCKNHRFLSFSLYLQGFFGCSLFECSQRMSPDSFVDFHRMAYPRVQGLALPVYLEGPARSWLGLALSEQHFMAPPTKPCIKTSQL